MITIRKASSADIPLIASIARSVWPDAYKTILTQAQLEYMLELFYSSASLKRQMNEMSHQFILAMADNNKVVGFASYGAHQEDPKIYHLHKIYVLTSQQKTGAGKVLVDYIKNELIAQNIKALQLNVNRNNKAVGFYQKKGFKIIKTEDIDIGNGYFMNDYVMELPLNQSL